jgi:hypothetical protein
MGKVAEAPRRARFFFSCVVAFYSEAVGFGFTDDEAEDLEAFLAAL